VLVTPKNYRTSQPPGNPPRRPAGGHLWKGNFHLMRIAIPVANRCLAQHFGHCEKFALLDVDPVSQKITHATEVDAPEHQPGLLPAWLRDQGVNLVIAGGMGTRARTLFEAAAIQVITGAPAADAATIARQYLAGALVTGENACDH